MTQSLASWQPVNLIQLILVAQCLLFSLFLFTQKKAIYLGGFLFVMALHMGFNIHEEAGPFLPLPVITHAFGFLYGPMLYLFVKEMCYQDFEIKASHLLHGIPFLIALPAPYWLPLIGNLLGPGIVISLASYLGFGFYHLHHYHKVLQQTQSVELDYRLDWLNRFLLILVAVALLDFIRHLFGFMGQDNSSQFFYALVLLMILGLVTYLLLKAMNQPQIFSGITSEDENLLRSVKDDQQSMQLSLDENQYQQICDYIEVNSCYLDPGLSINELALQLKIPTRELSRYVNHFSGRNFSDFINHYRVQHACEQLRAGSSSKGKLLEILLDSGFNSKSSFNAIFKREMNLTPSQYRDQARQ